MTTEYTPTNREARLAEAGQALETELGQDPAVSMAKTNYEAAQQQLAEAEERKRATPYPGVGSKYKLSQWHAAVNEVQACKVLLTEAEKAFRVAQNDAASALYAQRLQEQRNAQQERRDTLAAQHAMLEEENARSQAEQYWTANGGTKASFEKAWPDMWQEELRRRVVVAQEQERRLSAARNAF